MSSDGERIPLDEDAHLDEGKSDLEAEIGSALKVAFDSNMVFMMSKSPYLYDARDHNGPPLMFFTSLKDGKDWELAHPARRLSPGLCWNDRNTHRRCVRDVARWSDRVIRANWWLYRS